MNSATSRAFIHPWTLPPKVPIASGFESGNFSNRRCRSNPTSTWILRFESNGSTRTKTDWKQCFSFSIPSHCIMVPSPSSISTIPFHPLLFLWRYYISSRSFEKRVMSIRRCYNPTRINQWRTLGQKPWRWHLNCHFES